MKSFWKFNKYFCHITDKKKKISLNEFSVICVGGIGEQVGTCFPINWRFWHLIFGLNAFLPEFYSEFQTFKLILEKNNVSY